nr:unnamed protein product [Spirometra erinaceieuropaei]
MLTAVTNATGNSAGAKLRCLYTNAQSLISKLDELKLCLVKLSLGVLAATETRLSGNINDNEVALPGYQIYRRDREHRQGGGIVVYVNDGLAVSDNNTKFACSTETISLTLKATGSPCLDVLTVYRPPRTDRIADTQLLEQLEKFSSRPKIMIMGDFNAPGTNWNTLHALKLGRYGWNLLRRVASVSMRMTCALVVLALYVAVSAGDPVEKSHLQHMHLLFRHGDRTPISTFPLDGHPFDTTWPEGAGQLTQLGIEQQYLLGTWIRESYPNFIPPTKAFLDQHKSLFDLLRNVSGLPKLDVHDLWIVQDDLICLEAHNFSLPNWYTPAVKEELGVVAEYLWKLRYNDDERLRLELGVFLNDMIEHLDAVINPNASSSRPVLSSRINKGLTSPQIMAYSAHDENVAALLSALGVYENETKPEYASLVMLELHGPQPPADPAAYRIRVRYKRSWQDASGQYLTLPACTSTAAPSEGCEYKKVVEYLRRLRLRPDDFESACRAKSHSRSFLLLVGFATLGVLLALCGLISLVCLIVYRRRLHSQYQLFSGNDDLAC